jgi:hypothetical protein
MQRIWNFIVGSISTGKEPPSTVQSEKSSTGKRSRSNSMMDKDDDLPTSPAAASHLKNQLEEFLHQTRSSSHRIQKKKKTRYTLLSNNTNSRKTQAIQELGT